jgi:hypothetical protein
VLGNQVGSALGLVLPTLTVPANATDTQAMADQLLYTNIGGAVATSVALLMTIVCALQFSWQHGEYGLRF